MIEGEQLDSELGAGDEKYDLEKNDLIDSTAEHFDKLRGTHGTNVEDDDVDGDKDEDGEDDDVDGDGGHAQCSASFVI